MNKFKNLEQTVYIVDDDDALRDSIKELLESVNLKTKLFCSAVDFLSYYQDDYPGCLVLDIRLAKMSGLVLQRVLNEKKSKIPIVIITGHADVALAVDVMKAGAIDILQKPYQAQVLLDAVNNALLVDDLRRSEIDKKLIYKQSFNLLTERQKEVLVYLLKGMTSKMIAKELSISHRTIETHRKNILAKFSANSMSELITQKLFIDEDS